MRHVNEIILHCSATQPNWMHDRSLKAKVDEIRRWHKARRWSDIGYHYLIDRDGKIMSGRPIERTGAHVRGHNAGTIGVCLIGGHGSSADDEFSENFTIYQEKALRSFLEDLKNKHSITKVSGHNQYAPKACPGFNVPIWIRSQKQEPPRKRFFAGFRRFFKPLFG